MTGETTTIDTAPLGRYPAYMRRSNCSNHNDDASYKILRRGINQ
jgi:hypothetical protein